MMLGHIFMALQLTKLDDLQHIIISKKIQMVICLCHYSNHLTWFYLKILSYGFITELCINKLSHCCLGQQFRLIAS